MGTDISDPPAHREHLNQQELNDLVDLIAHFFQTSVVYFSIESEQMQVLQAQSSIPVGDMSSLLTFVHQVMKKKGPIVIKNLKNDVRYLHLYRMKLDARTCFYAGHPVYDHQQAMIGVLCLIDIKPHPFDAIKMQKFVAYARLIGTLLDKLSDDQNIKQTEQRLEHAEMILEQGFQQASVGMALLSISGRFLRINPCLSRLLGRTNEQVKKYDLLDWIYVDDQKTDLRAEIKKLLMRQEAKQFIECQILSAHGPLWVQFIFSRINDLNCVPLRYLLIVADISERKQAVSELHNLKDELENRILQRTEALNHAVEQLNGEVSRRKKAQHQLRKLTDNLPLMISHHDGRGRYLFANKTYEEVLGLSTLELLAQGTVLNVLGEEIHQRCQSHIEVGLDVDLTFDAQLETRAGRRWFAVTLVPDLTAGYFFLQLQDVTHVRRRQQKLEFAAYHDALTRLPNRRAFLWQLQQAMDDLADTEVPFAILFIDLDGFKSMNDTFGHEFGDQVLKVTAEVIQSCIRPSDYAARLGGDEFTVLLGQVHVIDVEHVCQRMLSALRELHPLGKNEVNVHCSIGAVIPDILQSADADYWLTQADEAMYQAKSKGKGTYVIL